MGERNKSLLYILLILVIFCFSWIPYIVVASQATEDISSEMLNLMKGLAIGAPLLPGTILIIFMSATGKQWGAPFLVVAFLNLFGVTGGWPAFCGALVAGILMFVFLAYLQRDLYDGNFSEAFTHFGRMAFGDLRGGQHIDDGKIMSPKSTLPVKGPCHLNIAAGNAVVIKSRDSGIPPRVLFRGATIEADERVALVYALGRKQMPLGLDDVVSSDYITCVVQASAEYGINVSNEAKEGKELVSSEDPKAVLALATAKPDWESATLRAFERGIRQRLNGKSVKDLMQALSYDDLETDIRKEVTIRTEGWGVKIHYVSIQRIQVPKEITAAKEREWARFN